MPSPRITTLLALVRRQHHHPSPSSSLHHRHLQLHQHVATSSSARLMSSNSDPQNPPREPQQQQAQDTQTATDDSKLPEHPPAPGLPPPALNPDSAQAHKLKLNDRGVSVRILDGLGPVVVNTDGSLSRIENWREMTESERETTKRLVGRRNRERLDALNKGTVEHVPPAEGSS